MKKFLIVILAILLLWLGGFWVFVLSLHKGPATNGKADAIVVLTGGKNRVETGLSLFAQGSSKELFITGVYEDVSFKDITNKWTGDTPLPECCITLGYEATTTEENALEVKKWLRSKKVRSIILVTSHYHMPRALVEFERAGLNWFAIHPYPVVKGKFNSSDRHYWEILFTELHFSIPRGLQTWRGSHWPEYEITYFCGTQAKSRRQLRHLTQRAQDRVFCAEGCEGGNDHGEDNQGDNIAHT